jgi:hypothetical protein
MSEFTSALKKIDWIALAIAFPLFIYVIGRATLIGITHDEALTFINAQEHTLPELFNGTVMTANNHFLNSFFIKVFMGWFGNDILVIRLFSVLCFLPFTFFTYKILRLIIENKVVLYGSFLVQLLNPYLLEFFSLARGYAPAVAFMTISVYHLVRYFYNKEVKLYYVFVPAFIAVLCNFVLLQFTCALAAVIVVGAALDRKYFLRTLYRTSVWVILIMIIVAYPVYLLMINHEFYFGGEHGLYADTLLSILYSYNYRLFDRPHVQEIWLAFFHIVLFLGLLVLFSVGKKINTNVIQPKNVIAVLFVFTILVGLAQTNILHSKYLFARTALFLLPLGMLAMYSLIDGFSNIHKFFSYSIILTWSCIVLAHVFVTFNFKFSVEWPYEENNRKTFQEACILARDYDLVEIGVDPLHFPAFKYYFKTTKNSPDIIYYSFATTEWHSPVMVWTTDSLIIGNANEYERVSKNPTIDIATYVKR